MHVGGSIDKSTCVPYGVLWTVTTARFTGQIGNRHRSETMGRDNAATLDAITYIVKPIKDGTRIRKSVSVDNSYPDCLYNCLLRLHTYIS